MQGNKNQGHRRSIRLENYDYSQAGAYFVTICERKRRCIFGRIINGAVRLSQIGKIVQEVWLRSEKVYKNVSLDEFVIMPNHIHGIIVINEDVGARPRLARNNKRASHGLAPTIKAIAPPRGALGRVIGQFKSSVTRQINKTRKSNPIYIWQRNYYDRVIRNEDELNYIRQYIIDNPVNWDFDRENPRAKKKKKPQEPWEM
ncbi:MAG: transposase [Planctomycetota bacterium]|nr:MAG: transposase [Planctomycetota bacterium]